MTPSRILARVGLGAVALAILAGGGGGGALAAPQRNHQVTMGAIVPADYMRTRYDRRHRANRGRFYRQRDYYGRGYGYPGYGYGYPGHGYGYRRGSGAIVTDPSGRIVTDPSGRAVTTPGAAVR
jgi:hypothetical protein